MTAPRLLESSESVCVLTFLNSNLPCKVASCLLDSVYLHRQSVIRVTVMHLFKVSGVVEQRVGLEAALSTCFQ